MTRGEDGRWKEGKGERGEGVPCSGVLGPLGFISVFTLPGHMLHNK